MSLNPINHPLYCILFSKPERKNGTEANKVTNNIWIKCYKKG